MVMERRVRAGASDSAAAAHPTVRIEPMRRRHLRGVLRIEQAVNPRPWSLSLFMSELRYRRLAGLPGGPFGPRLVGYAGLMLVAGDGHVTNVGVDAAAPPRQGIATRLLLELARRALAEGAEALTLEVRMSNTAAQALYRRFGFVPGRRPEALLPGGGAATGSGRRWVGAGGRSPGNGPEDALIMWANDIDTTAYRARLLAIERSLPTPTVREDQ